MILLKINQFTLKLLFLNVIQQSISPTTQQINNFIIFSQQQMKLQPISTTTFQHTPTKVPTSHHISNIYSANFQPTSNALNKQTSLKSQPSVKNGQTSSTLQLDNGNMKNNVTKSLSTNQKLTTISDRQSNNGNNSSLFKKSGKQKIQQGYTSYHDEFNKQNTIPLAPYEIISTMVFDYLGSTTYRTMLTKDKQYDKNLITKLQNLNNNLLNDKIFLFLNDIQPQNIQYQIWKHPSQFVRFMNEVQPQIAAMNHQKKRWAATGQTISQLYHSKLKNITSWNQKYMSDFVSFLTLLGNHPFLRKSAVYLTFIQHCMPMYLWNIKVYQQVPIYYQQNFFIRLFKGPNQIKQYITITGDGIILSTKNPLDTLIDQMVPFTNQFTFRQQISQNQLYFIISSCSHQNITINFNKDYIAGINFYIGIKRAFYSNYYNIINRFQSFSKTRNNCWVKLYNDGQQYFNDLCNELQKCRKQVCITDWWLTPYFLLKRNPKNGPISIHKTAHRIDGILRRLGQRGVKIFIILFRQPLGMLSTDSYECQIYLQSLSRNIRIRRHPIVPQLWSHHEKCVIIDQRIGFMGGLDICFGRWDTPQHHIINQNNYWDGGDYVNERLRGYAPGTTKFYQDSPINRNLQARMPWHDIGMQHRGDSVIDSMRHFIQYWYFVDAQRIKDPYNHIRNLRRRFDRAASYVNVDWDNQTQQNSQHEQGCGQKVMLCGQRTKLFITGTQKRLPQLLIQVRQGKKKGDMQLQLCRSASGWSIGARNDEHSIHNAYQALIRQSQQFIYIQNQFFMGTENKIVECIAERVSMAHLKKQNFKVIVVMPLLPGFQGDISKRESGPLRVQVYNQYQSINRGQNSLHARLQHLQNFNIDNYIFFFGLRGHAKLDNKAITELIYVHSKLMIVDDKRAIIGSANINDRSLCGNRDSELAMVIEEDNGNIYDGKPRKKTINNLRCRLFEQHFGLKPEQTSNINSPQIWQKIISNAKRNTLIYRKLFGCYSDDTITTASEVQKLVEQSDPTLYDQLAPQIYAHAVQFPLHFMENQDLQFRFGQMEGLLGNDAFL